MKKLFYYVLPLMCLPLSSCAKAEDVFSREALPKEITEAEIIAVKGFKNRFYYLNNVLSDITTDSYDNQGRLVGSRVAQINQQGYAPSNNVIEYEYNKNNLLLSEKNTLFDEEGIAKTVNLHTTDYDEHQNPIKDRKLAYDPDVGFDDDDGGITYTHYTYNARGNITKIDQNTFNNGIQKYKTMSNFSYDKKGRLIRSEKKAWNENFDDPDAYTHFSFTEHIYNGRQITDIAEATQYIGTPDEEKSKQIDVCDYDSNYNLTHRLVYVYATNDIEKVSEKIESFYQYNSKNLETLYNLNAYDMTKIPPQLTRTIYRTTNYCGPQDNKIESRNTIICTPGDTTGNIVYTNVHNYYDEKWNVVKQEIDSNDNDDEKQNIKTYYFEY